MIKGHDFYAVWDEAAGFWTKDEGAVQRLIDQEIRNRANQEPEGEGVSVLLLENYSSKKWSEWKSYVHSLPDNYVELDENVIFSNMEVKKEDYVSKKLDYPLAEGGITAYEEIISTLYDPGERQKLEWAIGAVVSGDSKSIQKFVVLYGDSGTGKSTILNIIQMMFKGYYSVFDAKTLGGTTNAFALEAFMSNPLIAIQHDGDLSRIEDNTKLNSIVSHEPMLINEKFKSAYQMKFNAFLFMGTNKPVKITDAKSGIIRRLIDVSPSGRLLYFERYQELMHRVQFELGAIAYHCLQVYKKLGKNYYDSYKPITMIGATNDFFNFVEDSYYYFKEQSDGVGLKTAWLRYKEYCSDANVPYPYSMRVFKEELKNYFSEYLERYDGQRSWYRGFKAEKFVGEAKKTEKNDEKSEDEAASWLVFDQERSALDDVYADCPAQYASEEGTPMKPWDTVTTKLADIDTTKLHYARLKDDHGAAIFIDFDLKDENGEKSLEKNIEAASKWPPTYAELSKSGCGIHLHYIFTGNPEELARLYAENVEIKTFTGKNSLRRKLSKCNSLPITVISGGLPMKGEKKVPYDTKTFENERHLRAVIEKCLNKEVHPDTRSNVDYIAKCLDDAYNSGMTYDLTDLRQRVLIFANNSTNQSVYCVKKVALMPFASDNRGETGNSNAQDALNQAEDMPIVIFDLEVFPNLFVCCYKILGDEQIHGLVNPTPEQCQMLAKYRLVGFNNRKYDNHILYGRMQGLNNYDLYILSKRIVSGDEDAFFSSAYNLSYTDIFDFSKTKQSLKKWEIQLGKHHQELGLQWDDPVPEELWDKVVEYCKNDVDATEAVWYACAEDWDCRQMLSEVSGLSVNAKNNSHSEQIVFGDDKNPQIQFVYTDLREEFPGYDFNKFGIDKDRYIKDEKGKAIFTTGKSIYMGEDPSEGGYAWSKPGMYGNVALLDIASMHPTTMIVLNLFGDKYTARVKELVELRLAIKHGEYDKAALMFNGKMAKHLGTPEKAEALAGALKIVINSIYGLTAAHFPNRFRDPRNVDNIVAKRGALFMIKLKNEVIKQGYTPVHCKTDSIKIADADEKIIQFVMDFGHKYGYTFEHQETYDKMCIVNKSTYIARYRNEDGSLGKWTATAAQFAVPYVFKSLFSKEPITFDDVCETKSVQTALYLDMNEDLPQLSPEESKDLKKLEDAAKKDTLTGTDPGLSRLLALRRKERATHNYIFVGRVGQFCPIKQGCGGGELVRDQNGSMYAVTGTSDYRWLESEPLRATIGSNEVIPDIIDLHYYENLVNDAVDDISAWGDFEWFTSDDPYRGDMRVPITAYKTLNNMQKEVVNSVMNPPEVDDELPFA